MSGRRVLEPPLTRGSLRLVAVRAVYLSSALALVAALLVGVTAALPAEATTGRNPVLLVHGLTADSLSWVVFKARLEKDGFRVFTVDIPDRGFGDISRNSQYVAAKVAEIKKVTGAAKVDVIGHSEGGLLARHYIKYRGGSYHVGRYVSLGTPQYGTVLANFSTVFNLASLVGCTACYQMSIGSSFLANLNSGDDTPGPVKYTTVYTVYDELVQPYWNAALKNQPVTNVKIQSICPNRIVGHIGLVLDGTTYQIARAALRDQTPSWANVNCWAL